MQEDEAERIKDLVNSHDLKINEITAAFGLTKSCPKAEYKIVGIVIKSGAPIINAIANSSMDKIKTIKILAKTPDFNEGK